MYHIESYTDRAPCIVAGPGLRHVVEHPRVEPTSPSAASLKKHMGELGCEALQNLIQPQDILMVLHLRLRFRDIAIAVPLDILDIGPNPAPD